MKPPFGRQRPSRRFLLSRAAALAVTSATLAIAAAAPTGVASAATIVTYRSCMTETPSGLKATPAHWSFDSAADTLSGTCVAAAGTTLYWQAQSTPDGYTFTNGQATVSSTGSISMVIGVPREPYAQTMELAVYEASQCNPIYDQIVTFPAAY